MTDVERDVRVGGEHASSDAQFAQLLRELTPELLRYFARRVPDAEDCADCLAETMLAAWRRIDDLPAAHESRRMWIYGIARLVASNQRRGNARRIALTNQLAQQLRITGDQPQPEPDVEVLDALGRLPEIDREVVQLVVWESFSLAEAATIMGISAAAARKRYSRARVRLRQQLGITP